MVNTRSQKRKGVPRRATLKNLKNRNAQTKRRGQQKGGYPGENVRITDEPTHMTRKEVHSEMANLLDPPTNPNLPLTNKILVFDFDATLTTFAGHSRGRQELLLNGRDKFGGKLLDLQKKLKSLQEKVGYTLYINSRSSRCALLKFFGKLLHPGYNSSPNKELGNLFSDIYGSSKSGEGVNCDKLNIKGVPTTGETKKNWQEQKMKVINDIIKNHGGKDNIAELYFFDDEEGNIDEFNRKFEEGKFIGVTVHKDKLNRTELFLLGDLNRLFPEEEQRDDLVGAQGTDPGYVSDSGYNSGYDSPKTHRKDNTSPQDDKHVIIKLYTLGEDILLLFKDEPNKRIKIGDNNNFKRAKLDNNEITIAKLNIGNNKANFITYGELKNKLFAESDKVFGSGQLSYLVIDSETLTVSYETVFNANPQKQHLAEFIKRYLPQKSSRGGGRKSKSNPKTITQKRRSTNPKNKRTRKSKK